MPGRYLNLLSLDGGGVRGLSSLYILKRILNSIDHENPPKPCDYFDIIGGTSTGGLIAIMLGRLEMSIDECIKTYLELSKDVFHKTRRIPIGIKGDLKERYDSEALELAVKKVLRNRGVDEDTLLKNPQGTKVFVCCTSGETSQTALLRTWPTTRGDPELYETVRIWEAARATSAASTFFDSITIGEPGQRFLDGGTGANNPIRHIWGEATDLLPRQESLLLNLGCLISIGTGQPGYKRFEETIQGIGKALLEIATETEATANEFHREHSRLFKDKICFRFNVPRGLGDIGLAETEQISAIKSMTDHYLQTEAVQGDIEICVQQLGARQINLSLQSPGTSSQMIDRVTQDEDQDFITMSRDFRWLLADNENDSQDLLEHISKYRPQRVHGTIKKQGIVGTTKWIVQDILTWTDGNTQGHRGHERCLWLSGTVGCGKTFIANTAFQTLLDIQGHLGGYVGHYYFDPNKHDTLTTEDLLRSYVKQFLRHLYGTQEILPEGIGTATKRIFGSYYGPVNCEEIVQELLIPLLQEFGRSFLLVDGLDLCSPQEYRVALECFSSLLQETSVEVLICGRNELNVTRRLEGSVRLEITAAKTASDVALFVEQYVKERSMYSGLLSNDPSTIARIKEVLIERSDGMFLWARLQIDILGETCTTDAQIDFALSNLPRDLDETYERCLLRVQAEQRPYSLRVLRYVYSAKSPLTIDALGEALATDPETGELRPEQIPRHAVIISSGMNLIVFDEGENLVVPAHHSVRNFLDNSKASVLQDLELFVWYDAEIDLGELCIAHLLWHISDSNTTTEDFNSIQLRLPLIESMRHWLPSKARLAIPLLSTRNPSSPFSSSNQGEYITLPPTTSRNLNAIKSLHGSFHSYARANWISLTRNITYGSANWPRLAGLILPVVQSPVQAFEHGDAQMFPWKSHSTEPLSRKILGWAISYEHLPLLELGMRWQEDLSVPLDDYEGLLPLHLAAKKGHTEVFQRLQGTRDIWTNDTCPKTGRTALHYAAETGCSRIIDSIPKDPFEVAFGKYDHERRLPLHLAVISGSRETIEKLLSRSADVLLGSQDLDALLYAFLTGGLWSHVMDYVLQKLDLKGKMRSRARLHEQILAWVIRTNNHGLIPGLVKAGMSLDIYIDSRYIDGHTGKQLTRRQTISPAIFFALECLTPDMATAFFENGASSSFYHYLVPFRLELYPMDIILSRGWTSLASLLCKDQPSTESYNEEVLAEFNIQVTGSTTQWLSLLMIDWIITDILCDLHDWCPFAANLDDHKHEEFLYFRHDASDETHSLRILVAYPVTKRPSPPSFKFLLMMGTRSTQDVDWRVGPIPLPRQLQLESGVSVGVEEQEMKLEFNENPYNIQCIRISEGEIQCSTNMARWSIRQGRKMKGSSQA